MTSITPATNLTHGPFRKVVGVERVHGTICKRVPGEFYPDGRPKLQWVPDLSDASGYDIEQLECGHFGRRVPYQPAQRRRCGQCGQEIAVRAEAEDRRRTAERVAVIATFNESNEGQAVNASARAVRAGWTIIKGGGK